MCATIVRKGRGAVVECGLREVVVECGKAATECPYVDVRRAPTAPRASFACVGMPPHALHGARPVRARRAPSTSRLPSRPSATPRRSAHGSDTTRVEGSARMGGGAHTQQAICRSSGDLRPRAGRSVGKGAARARLRPRRQVESKSDSLRESRTMYV